MRLERECQDKTSMNTNAAYSLQSHPGYTFNSFALLFPVVRILVVKEIFQRFEKSQAHGASHP